MIDPKLLPTRPLLDTGVLIRAWRLAPDPAWDCAGLWKALLKAKRDVLVAAPSVAEILRFGDGTRQTPGVSQVIPVSFNRKAAEVVGSKMPMEVLKSLSVNGTTLTHLKFDSMIVACAVAGAAGGIIAIDPDIHALAKHVGMKSYFPNEFLAKQTSLPLVAAEAAQGATSAL